MKVKKVEHPINRKIREAGKLEAYPSPSIIFPWCCDCGLRHALFIEVARGKTKKQDVVVMKWTRDDWGTDARKELDKLYSKKKK